ncbi:MAG: DUF2167 domain-containing protein [Gammaproteobacteria bacterium]|nr:DUF2167 domain-containing protein [Gammaproteobacteria bacterium]MBI5614704.1 DUF2167 domain-containing protein [Gammaproteobacteria bacterium]
MQPYSRMLCTLALCVYTCAGHAAEAPSAGDARAAFEASLHYETGDVELGGGIASLHLNPAFRYLAPGDTARLLTEGWGNPSGDGTLGMLLPVNVGPLDPASFGVVITYEEEGHISDADADKIDYAEMLRSMKERTAKSNEERRKQGVSEVELVGWAEPPHYDAASHKLYWAKELAFKGAEEHTLNYDIRVLGRKGVLVLTAVSGMAQLESIKRDMRDVVAFTDFKPGNTYAEFDPTVDKVAAYGLAALIAGGIAAKSGLIAKLIALAIAGKKGIAVVVIGAVAVLRRLFGKRKSGGSA